MSCTVFCLWEICKHECFCKVSLKLKVDSLLLDLHRGIEELWDSQVDVTGGCMLTDDLPVLSEG